MTGRHAAAAARRRGGLGPVRLLRHGFPAGYGTALLLAAITLVTTSFLVALPQLAAGTRDRGLADAVAAAGAGERDVALRLTPKAVGGLAVPSSVTGLPASPPFAAVDAAVRGAMSPRAREVFEPVHESAQSDPFVVLREGRPLDVPVVEVVIRLDDVVTDGVRWVAGGPPTAPATTTTLRTATDQVHTVSVVPVALSAEAAAAWGVEVGDVLELSPSEDATRRVTPTAVVVSGTFEPLDATAEVWSAEPRMTRIAKVPFGDGETKDQAAVLAPLASYAAVADGIWRIPRRAGEPSTASPALDHTWRYRIAADRLVSSDAGPLRSLLLSLSTDQDVWSDVPERPALVSGLGGLLDAYDRDVAVTDVMTSFVTGGVTALAVLVLGLTALVGADRRAAELRLLRSRGAATGVVVGLVGAWTAALGVPAAVLAAVVTAAALPGEVPRATVLEVALVALLPLLAAVGVTWRRVRALEEAPDETRDLGRAARRVVAEVVVLAVAAGAVFTVRSRGDVIASGSTDWFATVTPVLLALAAAVVALRVIPGPVGLLAGLAARGRGLVGWAGLTRAARAGASAALPITALVVGTTLVTLTSTLAATVDAQRDVAAYRAVGADARVEAARIDPADVAGLAAREGVGAAVPALVDRTGGVVVDGRESLVTVIAVDPVAYAALLADTAAAVDLPPMTASGGELPVVLSGGPSADRFDLVVRGSSLPARRVGTAPGLVRAFGDREVPVALVPFAALADAHPGTQPDTVFLVATADAQRALADSARRDRSELGGLVTRVVTVEAQRTSVSDRALARFLTASYLGGTVLGGILTLLALLLLLETTRPARTQLVIRLRTLGLPHGGERRLAWSEVMPLLSVGVLAGVLAGVYAPVAVAAALDLSPFTGAVGRLPVEPRPVAGALAGAGVLVLGALALLTDAVSARHGDLAQHLRRGDSA